MNTSTSIYNEYTTTKQLISYIQ